MNHIVLAVEDDLQEQLLITRAIGEIPGVTLITVDTGGDAIDYINRRGPYELRRPKANPSLVIADHQLPDMLAIDLVRFLRDHPTLGATPVFVYGEDVNGEASEYSHLGVDGPIVKPGTCDAFRSAVHDAVHRHLRV